MAGRPEYLSFHIQLTSRLISGWQVLVGAVLDGQQSAQ
jgi:hypothetical protein